MNLSAMHWLTPVALLLWAALAQAQATPAASAPTATRASASPLGYQSAIQAYKPFVEAPVISWRAANDTTAQVGGWRTYAKEARQPDEPGKDASGKQEVAHPTPDNRTGGRP
ncbi:MAG: hypothetical protein KAY54_01875 [Burkholderiaceae bacterium]|nr:hypothetical protein [Burkholderiaceae bacterium]